MFVESLIFSIFSSLVIISSILVIRSKNPVHSVLFLILVFCNSSGLLLLLGLDFFAMVFLVVYVGAIAVLFLFVVMMLNIKITEISENILHYIPVGTLIGLVFLLEVFLVVENDFIAIIPTPVNDGFDAISKIGLFLFIYFNSLLNNLDISRVIELFNQSAEISNQPIFILKFTQWVNHWETYSNIEALGFLIYTYYFPYFLLASLILLIAMIGAITLTLNKNSIIRKQEVFKQNAREFTKTIKKLQT